MERRWRVRDRATFAALRRDGVRRRARTVSVTRLDDGSTPPRVAYAIGRGVGTAVTRNRLRRRLRAIVAARPLAPGTYLVSAGPAAATLADQDLRADLDRALA
ncbi:MAG TPA: ribonuclease P protein component [Acidimicrobiales bacterium]|nr:ribonuclease P protein component [Acidimicrobiales bacterium]